MKTQCTITLEFDTAEKARTVLRSIQADDQGFVKSTVKGSMLEAVMESNSIASLLHTLDDYFACVSIAADIVKK